MTLWLKSSDFSEGDRLGERHVLSGDFGFGCDGGNLSPQLEWGGELANRAKSWAITCFDPDAPTGCGFWHWLVIDIPPEMRALDGGAGSGEGQLLPDGAVQIRTDFGRPGYGGPCPPAGSTIHRYIFSVHALKVRELPVPRAATAAVVSANLGWNRIGKADLIGIYRRRGACAGGETRDE